jgi:hypothetical protein
MESLSNDILRLLLSRYMPISAIGIMSAVCRRFRFLAADECLFSLICCYYSPTLTTETKRSYTGKHLVETIHYYQVKFSKTVHCRYGLAFGPDKVKLLNTESNIFTSFDYRGLLINHAKYSERVDVLHFAEPKHNFFTTPVEEMQPLYRPCLSNKIKKKLPVKMVSILQQWVHQNWSPVQLCPSIQKDGSWTSKLTEEKNQCCKNLHPYDYFYGLELHGQRYRQVIRLDIPEQFRRANKLPPVIILKMKC